ncbi:hypothetical protein GQ53DRAFT_184183 [Thozetella sp. PMI_491]|nr:hypothetical protein GQ53DRAFT_184183 [Thozetella sp. PMI_491]
MPLRWSTLPHQAGRSQAPSLRASGPAGHSLGGGRLPNRSAAGGRGGGRPSGSARHSRHCWLVRRAPRVVGCRAYRRGHTTASRSRCPRGAGLVPAAAPQRRRPVSSGRGCRRSCRGSRKFSFSSHRPTRYRGGAGARAWLRSRRYCLAASVSWPGGRGGPYSRSYLQWALECRAGGRGVGASWRIGFDDLAWSLMLVNISSLAPRCLRNGLMAG